MMKFWSSKSMMRWAGLVYPVVLLGAGLSNLGAVGVGDPTGGALGKLTLGEQPSALLGGRLSLKMPAAAKMERRGHGVMAAPEANEDETRIVVDAGNERLVLMTYELYALSGGDLEKAVRADIADTWGKEAATVKLEKFDSAAPLAAVAVIPPRPDGKREANLVFALYVGSADGTVQYLAFYVNPVGAKDIAGVTALARKIAASVTSGDRKLSWKAGLRSFPGVGRERLVLTVPEGFVAGIQEGPDFWIYRVRKLAPLGKPPMGCSIYLGGHPSYQYRQADEAPEKVMPLKGKLLGQAVEWQTWSQGGQTTTEGIVPYPKGKGMAVHVFCSAGSEAEATALRTMAETLQVEEGKK
jgi:hypothetical protein